MTSEVWIIQVRLAVLDALPDLEIFSADDRTTTFVLGLRGVVVHVASDVALLAPSISVGRTIASRLESKVEHLDPVSYGFDEPSAGAAARAITEHLMTRPDSAIRARYR